MITGEGLGRAELKDYAERLRTRLLTVEDAAKVALIGEVEERVFVEISHHRLATLGISPQAIFDAIGAQNAMTAAGAFQTSADEVQVRVSGDLGSLAALRDLPIAAGAWRDPAGRHRRDAARLRGPARLPGLLQRRSQQ